ncbi:MAG TPA: serine/threonine-protein kinase, partial [Gemmatimonadaceae bacterium]|nr:serine/threonine-protein kinase [Gemmatimonadaceae bacterium]
ANFIVHRDLKPANILVTNDGVVKLLDFGIAKLLEEGVATSTVLTAAHETIFTYRYAAPEQIRGEVTTTATDVYALGVILYELLVGRHPTSADAHSPAEHVVAILESDSAQLSRALTPSSTLTAEHAQQIAAARDASPERLRRTLHGDLENIVAKALKKVPAERYATVSELAADVRHYLNHEPVTARADSFGYRAGKFVRRHRVPVAIAALVAVGLVGAAVRERELRGRAESEAKKAVAVEEYLVSIFGAADPYAPQTAKPSDLTARALLDRGAQRIDTALSAQPDVRAELRGALGRVYANLAVYDKAMIQLRSSLAERREIYGANSAPVAEAMDQLGEVLMKEDSLDQADTLLRGGLAIRRRLFGNESDVTAESAEHLAELLSNKDAFSSADTLYREALAIRRGLHGDSDLTVATTRAKLGVMLNDEGKYPQAIAEFEQVFAIRQHRLGGDHPSTAEALLGLANSEERLGRYPESEQHYRAALAGERKTLGSVHRSVSTTLNDLGQMLFKVGRLDEADSLLREALAINRKLFGENHDAVSANLGNLALVVRERGDFDEAQRLLEQGLAIDRNLYGPDHIDVGFDLNEIAVVMRLRGRSDSAVAILRPVFATNRRLVGASNAGTIAIGVNLARALDEVGKDAEAEPMLRDALGKLDTANADQRLVLIPARIGLGRVLLNTHRAREALPVLESTVAMSRVRPGPQHWRTGESEVVLARCWMDLGRADSAEAPLREARTVLDKQRRAHPLLGKEVDAAGQRFAEMSKTK